MSSFSDIPNTPHWAIISTTSVSIPGDERSRTNPGHGYPASTESFITYHVFTSKAEWENEVAKLTLRKYGPAFKAVKVEVASVEVNIRVD